MDDSELILKYIRGEANKTEREELALWLSSDASNAALFAEMKTAWEMAGKLSQPFNIDTSKAWNSIQHQILQEQNDNKTLIPSSNKFATTSWLFRIAAVLIIALFATWFFVDKDELLITVQTGDAKRILVLQDCTHVFLNENSRFTYPTVFKSNQRAVSLSGEAFFEVTKDSERPFIISNNDFEVKVLGTSFNVSAYDHNPNAVVTVVTGTVTFEDRDGHSVFLLRNEIGVLNKFKHAVEKSKTEDLNFSSWKTRKLEFKNTSFKQVCETLTDYFSVELEVKNETILKCKFTGYFVDPTLEQILSVLEKTLEIKALVNNKHIIITGKGC